VIPRAEVVAWGRRVGWPTDEQVEQDLLLSRLIVEISNDLYLGSELVFRGGTCLHKRHADRAYRYSEDHLGIRPGDLVDCFGPYRPDGYTHRRAEQNLRTKLADVVFRGDLVPLVAAWPEDYDIDAAADLLITEAFPLL
jgi:hypothetical protein